MGVKLSHRLILNEWIFSKLGYASAKEGMTDLSIFLQRVKTGWNEQNVFYFSEALKLNLPSKREISDDKLEIYDSNIFTVWNKITKQRVIMEHREIYPLYFQYISLLLTEYYLDRFAAEYRNNHKELLEELENFRIKFNVRFQKKSDKIPEFTENDLRKLAFWMATGSGKTLIMHCNILQFEYYIKRDNLQRYFNKVILITPNEGLTKQHLSEFYKSDIAAMRYSNINSGNYVNVIEITKLKASSGVTTVAVSEFGKNNLVLVDEGHRGSGGDEWFNKRQQLCEEGFSFEYSATFGQAVNALSGSKKREMTNIYSKSILMDYSYKYFYRDGYGKDFYISVLEKMQSIYQTDINQHLYLTNNLLRFYQQCKLLNENRNEFFNYMIESPLMIIVGSTVTKTREKERDTDIVKALSFFARFIKNKEESLRNIELLLKGKDEILENGVINYSPFKYINSLHKKIDKEVAEKVYEDILFTVFNSAGGGLLHAIYMKGSGSEIGLKVGDSSKYFGVINIGEPRTLWKMLNDEKDIITTEQTISYSLFDTINNFDSHIKVLIGAKKFSEGWNSWRVSSMGLINVGKKEGSQIIQLFGRGVRLKGLNFSLKRTTEFENAPKYIEILETLNVFGINSDYMKEFQEYIEEEEVQKDNNFEEIFLPVILNRFNQKLKVIINKKDMPDFKKKIINLEYEEKMNYRIYSDWYSRIKSISNKFKLRFQNEGELNTAHFKEIHLKYMDFNKIYFELLHHKRKFAYYNLQIEKDAIVSLLQNKNWYLLYIPKHLMIFDDFKKVKLWEEIAISILKAYCDKFYKYHKNEFQAPYREYRTLEDILHSQEQSCINFRKNLISEYKVSVQKSRENLIKKLRIIKEEIQNKNFSPLMLTDIEIFNVSKHLYNPLIYVAKGIIEIKISPTKLNKNEKQFIIDLETWSKKNRNEKLRNVELYVLRNQERGKGIGFFDESNFYPDFIIWLVKNEKQKIIFADPHGLRNARSFDDPKILLSKNIKKIEKELNDANVSLESFIISPTPYNEIKHWASNLPQTDIFNQYNILFMYDDENYIEKLLDLSSI